MVGLDQGPAPPKGGQDSQNSQSVSDGRGGLKRVVAPPSDISTNQVYLAITLILTSIKTLEDLAPPVDEINSVFGDHMLLWRIVVPSQYLGG